MIDDFLYHRKPSLMDLDLLEYQPNNNGTKPSEHVKYVNSKELAKASATQQTRYGQRWFNEAPLSKERREKVLEKDEATRLNRRKTGDSPNAN